jgi:AraC-like DNA-binding protein
MLVRPCLLDEWLRQSILASMKGNNAWTPVDPLAEALHFLRMSGTFYCRSELSAPWALALPARSGCLSFHVVTSGRCWLEVEGADDQRLEPGDLALVPHGEGHRLSSEPGTPAHRLDELEHEKVSDRYAILRHGGGGAATSLVCGAVRFDHPAAHHLVKLLPRVIHVEASNSPHLTMTDWMQSTLRLMAVEARELRPGGETVITRLADILVIQAIRSWIERDPAAQTGWLGALQDKQIGRAIALIHRDPARSWTLASLASEVAMSRSAFAARFTALVGEPAMHYVARWRMHVALNWLKEDGAALGEFASRLGYRSEAAFSRAFKRFIGVSPGRVRRGEAPAVVVTGGTSRLLDLDPAQQGEAPDGASRRR